MMAVKYVNPYVFVPLSKRTPVRLGKDALVDEEKLTGVIHCKLTAKTPLSLPEVGTDTEPQTLPFFRIGGKLAIPGSSIRGAIRSTYEIITNSCLRTNDLHLHSVSSLKNPGLLAWDRTAEGGKGAFVLYKAERLRVTDERLVKRGSTYLYGIGQHVWFKGIEDKNSRATTDIVSDIGLSQTPSCEEEGYFLYVNKLRGSHPSVFVQLEGNPLETFDTSSGLKAVIACFMENVELFVENSKNKGAMAVSVAKAYYDAMNTFLEAREPDLRLPVWYSTEKVGEKTVYQLAHAQLSRSVYPQTPKKIAGDKAQCTSRTKLCPACTLFGFVSPGGEGDAKASSVRFGDAIAVDNTSTNTPGVWLPDLIDPRQSSFEFYLRNQAHPHDFSPETPGTELAGRKVYWHHAHGERWRAKEQIPTTMNARAELTLADTAFKFDVFVDKVTKRQLNELVYALTFGQAWGYGDTLYCHKIGHGKPVGLGSALVEVVSVAMRSYADGVYSVVTSSWLDADEHVRMPVRIVESGLVSLDAVKAVAHFSAIPEHMDIAYPTIEDNGDIFEWFGKNRNRWKPGAPVHYDNTLPQLPLEVTSACFYRKPSCRPKEVDSGRRPSKPRQKRKGKDEGRVLGRIKKFISNDRGGYGFIERDDGDSDLYFAGGFVGDKSLLRKGTRVSFVVGAKKDGKTFAKDLRRAN